MAAAVKAINARIRANPVADYICSTHFWGPASNFGIPLAAIMDMKKDPELISGPMTFALTGYSLTFMRYATAVSPKNWLLFGCHLINSTSQATQGYRWLNYHKFGGKEQLLEARAKEGLETAKDKAQGVADAVSGKAQEVINKVKS